MISRSQQFRLPPGAEYCRERVFKASTRRRWGCDVSLRRAACAGARVYFRERQQRRMTSGGQAEDRQGLGQDLDGLRVPLVNDSRDDESTSFNAGIKTQTGQVDEGEERAHSSARRQTTTESVPRSVEDLISRVIHVVKTSGTRLAVYLRGWDTLRAYSAGSVGKPPACKPCICTAAKTRRSKEDPPPHRGLFPCLPLPEKGDSLEEIYVHFVTRPRASSRLVEIRCLWRLIGGRQAKNMSP